jgi:uncharacterized spore protein YtfJ
MKIAEVLAHAMERFDAKIVFAEPVEKDGIVVIPAAKVIGGGGGGDGQDKHGQRGEGGGLGLIARPVGAFVIRDERVTWEPAVDVNRVVATIATVVIAAGVVVGRVLRAKAKRRK